MPHDQPASPAKFPTPASVVRVEVVQAHRSISDPLKIAPFLDALGSIESDWSFTWATYPTPQESVLLFDTNNRQICRIDFGPRWVGSDCGHSAQGWPPMANTTPVQDQYFQTFVGSKW
jgi:hypothetical protein